MGGSGSGGSRAQSGRKSMAAVAAGNVGRDPSQTSMRAFTTPDPVVVQREQARQENLLLEAQTARENSTVLAAEQARLLEEKRQQAIEILKKVMGEGGLEGSLDMLPEDSNGDDDDDDNDGDGDNCEDSNNSEGSPSRRRSTAYKPPNESPLGGYLRQIKDEILNESPSLGANVMKKGQHFIPPQFDPMASSTPTKNAEDWYVGNPWCFFWDPFFQYSLDMKSCKCPCCGKNVFESKEYDWRPFFYFDKVVWVIFRWVRCGDTRKKSGCGKTFATIDPEFMSKNVPTVIAETFPYVVVKRGPGMHRMMVYNFVELVTNRVQFGTFADKFNSLYRLNYDMSRLSYYSKCKSTHAAAEALGTKIDSFPTPFSRFETVGEYNGLRLTRQLVKKIFVQFMELHEPYLQASFQVHYDARREHCRPYAQICESNQGIREERKSFHSQLHCCLIKWACEHEQAGLYEDEL